MPDVLACLRRKSVAVFTCWYFLWDVIFYRSPGVSVNRLVILRGSLREGRHAHEFDRP